MWNRNVSTRAGLLIVALVALPLLGALVIPHFPPSHPPEAAVIATMQVLATARALDACAGSTALREACPPPAIVAPDGSRYAYRVQRTVTGLRLHAWPLTFDHRAPHLFFMDEDGSIWTSRDPAGHWVGIHRPPPLDAGQPDSNADSHAAARSRADRSGRIWFRT